MWKHCISVYRGNSPGHTPPILDVANTTSKVRTTSSERDQKTDCSVHDTINYRGARDELLLLIATWPSVCKTASPPVNHLFLKTKLALTWLPNKLPQSLISFLFRLPFTIVIDLVEWSLNTGSKLLSVVWQRGLNVYLRVCVCGLFCFIPQEQE